MSDAFSTSGSSRFSFAATETRFRHRLFPSTLPPPPPPPETASPATIPPPLATIPPPPPPPPSSLQQLFQPQPVRSFNNEWFNDIQYSARNPIEKDDDDDEMCCLNDCDCRNDASSLFDVVESDAEEKEEEEVEEEEEEEEEESREWCGECCDECDDKDDTQCDDIEQEPQNEESDNQQYLLQRSIFSDDVTRQHSQQGGIDTHTQRRKQNVMSPKQVEQQSHRQREIVQSEIQRTKLEIDRSIMDLQRSAALNFVLLRVRSMFNCVWEWTYQRYLRLGLLQNDATCDRDTFRIIVGTNYGQLEELQPFILWYARKSRGEFVFARALCRIRISEFSEQEDRIAQAILLSFHSSSDDAMARVSPLRYDDYWCCFLRALSHEMSKDQISRCASHERGITTLATKSDFDSTSNVTNTLAYQIDQFYWNVVQRQQPLVFIDNNVVFNDSTTMISPIYRSNERVVDLLKK